MRVLHLGVGNIYGGIERALVSYAAGRSASPEAMPSFGVAFKGQLERELHDQGVEVAVLGPARLSRPLSLTRARQALRRLMVRATPSVVVTHGPWAHCVFGPEVKQAGVPLAYFVHNPPSFDCLNLLSRTVKPSLLICNSDFTRRESQWLFSAVPGVVTTYPLQVAPRFDRDKVRAQLGLPVETVVILQASRLEPYKGHRLHLRALAELGPEPAWCALFAGGAQPGKGDYARSLVTLRARLGLEHHVTFLNHRDDVSLLLAAADVFCHPNVSPEPFGLAFVEAMQAGIPVIATRMGGASEILNSGGGLLVPPLSSSVARALRQLIADPNLRQAIGRRGQEVALERYTLEGGVRQLAAHLGELVRRNISKTRTSSWG